MSDRLPRVTLVILFLTFSAPAGAQENAPRRYALLVGVESYEHSRLREPQPLKYAVEDAAELADILKTAGYEVVLLTDATGRDDASLRPTRANIEAKLRETLRKCTASDTVLLAFAGHGLQFAGQKDAYFCPQDARPFADETETLVSISRIYGELEKSFAGVKVILVDACRNDPDPGRGRGLDADSAPAPPKGVAALFSCSAGQRAFEHDDLKHGVFFHHVLEGLAGEAANRRDEVTFDSLSSYVRDSVPQTIERLLPGHEQLPNMKADLVGRPPVLARIAATPAPNRPPPPDATTRPTKPANALAIFARRFQPERGSAVVQFGGNEQSEAAVDAGLIWLASTQQADGRWKVAVQEAELATRKVDNTEEHTPGRDADAGVTALALLAFLGAGHTLEAGVHSPTVRAAVEWLVSQQAADGSLAGAATTLAAAYCHAMATYALAEALALRSTAPADDELRAAVERAVGYSVDAQLDDGGWRYSKGQPEGDMSVTVWQVTALKAAERAGVPVSAKVRQRLIEFLRSHGLGKDQGLAGYRLREQPTPSMTAAALYARQQYGQTATNPASAEAVQYLSNHMPGRSTFDEYYYYHATLALFVQGGESWTKWNEPLRDLLVAEQQPPGNWDPAGTWGPYGGRVYATAMAILCLEVYYRYAPDAAD